MKPPWICLLKFTCLIGRQIAAMASQFGLDNLNTLFLTPLPGTRLWDQMKSEGRIALDAFPEDWRYCTLTFPVARYQRLSLDGVIQEMLCCGRSFYSLPRILRRIWSNVWQHRQPLISLVGNRSYRSNIRVDCKACADFKHARCHAFRPKRYATSNPSLNDYENHPSLSQSQRPGHLAPPSEATTQSLA